MKKYIQTENLSIIRLFLHYDDTDVFIHKARTDLRAAMISVALAQYHLDNSKYPESLDPLSPAYLETLPLDPFTDNHYDYHSDGNGKDYRLRSAGPDKIFHDDWAEYDRFKGLFSTGDLVY